MKEPEKIVIAKKFGLHYRELHKYMSMLGFARNKCAHDERFYDIRFNQRLHTKSISNFAVLKLPRDKSGSYTRGTCDAFASNLFDVEANQRNIERIRDVLGAYRLENIVARVDIDGQTYLFCFEVLRYDGKWYIHSLGGNIGALFNISSLSGGVILEAYLQW